MSIKSINPATNSLVKEFDSLTIEELNEKLERSAACFRSYRHTPFEYRKERMLKAAEVLRQRKEEFATIITLEMGKRKAEAIAEVEKCAWVCEFYAEEAEKFLAEELIASDASESKVVYQPLGPVLAIMPWNFPFWQVFRFAAPALMAGNTGLLKHASNVPQSALAIESVFVEAGFPEGAFQTLLIGAADAEKVIADPIVKAVTLTGSEQAGMRVARIAGKHIKKSVLELGGSDPFIVCADADLDLAVEMAVKSRFLNCGQSCIAAKRFIVEDSIKEAFLEKFSAKVTELKIGDPSEGETGIGPMARDDLAEELHHQVLESVKKGARVVVGGKRPELAGAYYEPTILTDVTFGMPAYDEELFGPVASVMPFIGDEHALMLANETKYGLGASVWTKDLERAKKFVYGIESGSVFVNEMVKSDPRLPFGGIKMSGYGRELSSIGIQEFVNRKTVYVK